jgi:hypothetical protein
MNAEIDVCPILPMIQVPSLVALEPPERPSSVRVCASLGREAGVLTIDEAQKRIELFLAGQMLEALRAVEYELPSFDAEPVELELVVVARSLVEIRHVRGAADATYFVQAFDDELLMQLQSTCIDWWLSTAYRPWTRWMPPLWRYVSSGGVSAPSMPAGSLAGAMRRSRVT